jgi:hypothetical protein
MKVSYDDIVVATVRWSILFFNFSYKLLQLSFKVLQAIYQGILPLLLGYTRLHKFNTLIYNHEAVYISEKWNMQGLWQWEQDAIGEYLSPGKHSLVLAAGGGREIIALASKGIEVDAWECNEQLRTYANTLLDKNNIPCRISLMEQNIFPVISNGKIYDFCIIGWAAYCHIFPREYRIQLLAQCKNVVNGPVFISYLPVYNRAGKSKTVWSVARKIILTMPWSFKDVHPDILIDPLGVYEGINEEKVKSEAAEAGYRLKIAKDNPYPHAVLLPDRI